MQNICFYEYNNRKPFMYNAKFHVWFHPRYVFDNFERLIRMFDDFAPVYLIFN